MAALHQNTNHIQSNSTHKHAPLRPRRASFKGPGLGGLVHAVAGLVCVGRGVACMGTCVREVYGHRGRSLGPYRSIKRYHPSRLFHLLQRFVARHFLHSGKGSAGAGFPQAEHAPGGRGVGGGGGQQEARAVLVVVEMVGTTGVAEAVALGSAPAAAAAAVGGGALIGLPVSMCVCVCAASKLMCAR